MLLENLERRALLAALVGDVLGGSKDTLITGTTYEDVNADGVRNNGENGIQGWRVFLDLDHSGTFNIDAVGVPEPSALTNKDGDYSIAYLQPGAYRVVQELPAGWKATSPLSVDVSVDSRKTTTADFFVFGGGTISGTIWNDANQDGVQNADSSTGELLEPGLAGWTVFLDLDANGALDAGDPQTTTTFDGSYRFQDVPPGDYEVTEVLPTGWQVSDVAPFDFHQTAGVNALQTSTIDFANVSFGNGSLRGTVWNDVNINGLRDVDPDTGEFTEPGLAVWTVFLDLDNSGDWSTDSAGDWEPSATTDADGNYVFVSLAAGRYQLTQVLPVGWEVSPEFDAVQNVTVEPGRNTTASDFADFTVMNGSISGQVWNDRNRNGARDYDFTGAPLEPGLAGWTFFLDLNRNRIADEGEPTQSTDAAGASSFHDLQIGEDEVREVLPTGWETSQGFDDNHTAAV